MVRKPEMLLYVICALILYSIICALILYSIICALSQTVFLCREFIAIAIFQGQIVRAKVDKGNNNNNNNNNDFY